MGLLEVPTRLDSTGIGCEQQQVWREQCASSCTCYHDLPAAQQVPCDVLHPLR
jgi:hypothetical protein